MQTGNYQQSGLIELEAGNRVQCLGTVAKYFLAEKLGQINDSCLSLLV